MYGILTEITNTGRTNIKAVRFEGCPNRYGRYEVMGNCYETDALMRQFERERRDRYERIAPSFAPDINPSIKKVIFNYPATIVIWSDGTKTVVKCQPGDVYSKELGLAMCISKKFLGNAGNFNNVFKKWIPEDEEPISDDYLTDLRKSFYNLGNTLGNIFKPTPTIKEKRYAIYKYCSARRCDECEINRLYKPRPGHCIDTDEDVIKHYNAIKEDK